MDIFPIKTAAIHITYVCTHKCPMCYANLHNQESQVRGHPSAAQIKRVINNLHVNGIQEFSFVGGDPAKHPQIFEISEYVHMLGGTLSTLSNTLDFPGDFSEIVRYINSFEATVHGESADTHDEFCGKLGAHNLLMTNLKRLSTLNARIGLALNMIPITHNHLYEIVSNVITQGVNVEYLVIQRIVPFGRAEGTREYELTIDQLDIALNSLLHLEEDCGLDIIVEDPFPFCAIDRKFHKYMHPCEWGRNKISLDYLGNISRCGADPRGTVGNIFEVSLNQLWRDSPELIAFREKKYLEPECKKCPLLEKCGGACPISSNPELGLTRDYLTCVREVGCE